MMTTTTTLASFVVLANTGPRTVLAIRRPAVAGCGSNVKIVVPHGGMLPPSRGYWPSPRNHKYFESILGRVDNWSTYVVTTNPRNE
eukprot:scaffold4929_cov176-Amphora_coffeaeformis.AAC.3